MGESTARNGRWPGKRGEQYAWDGTASTLFDLDSWWRTALGVVAKEGVW